MINLSIKGDIKILSYPDFKLMRPISELIQITFQNGAAAVSCGMINKLCDADFEKYQQSPYHYFDCCQCSKTNLYAQIFDDHDSFVIAAARISGRRIISLPFCRDCYDKIECCILSSHRNEVL